MTTSNPTPDRQVPDRQAPDRQTSDPQAPNRQAPDRQVPDRQVLGYVHADVSGQDRRFRRISRCLLLIRLAVLLHVLPAAIVIYLTTGMTLNPDISLYQLHAQVLTGISVIAYLAIPVLLILQLSAMRHHGRAILIGLLGLVPVMNILLAVFYAESARDFLQNKGRLGAGEGTLASAGPG